MWKVVIIGIAVVALLVGAVTFLPKSASVSFPQFQTNTAKASINLKLLLSGGPGKDGIAAITKPSFISLSQSLIKDDVMGILVTVGNDIRFYPFTILLWHEVVNDVVGGKPIAVTFCPLCGSAIVFDRHVKDEILEFHVSGYLYESNLVMYDIKTESFWSQAKGEAIVGDLTGTKLTVLPMQQLNLAQVKKKYPQAQILSDKTGYQRSYGFNPYGNYNETDDLYFPVSVKDKRFPLKEIMYVVPWKGKSVTFAQKKLVEGGSATFTVDGVIFTARRKDGEITVMTGNDVIPGYYEMWFSWAVHHQKDGVIWNL